MGDILTVADKFERAVRNGTGFNITRDEMVAMAEEGVLDAIFAAKLKRLKHDFARAGADRGSAPDNGSADPHASDDERLGRNT